jgi:hypothetical protein
MTTAMAVSAHFSRIFAGIEREMTSAMWYLVNGFQWRR